MAIRREHSKTSLRHTTSKPPDEDFYNDSAPRDFCNSFWGTGDVGPSVLFARMQKAAKTTDELKNFWVERATIEEEYASKMAKLARAPIGGDETGELRNSLNILRLETEKQAESHLELAGQLRQEFEHLTAQFHVRQINHLRAEQASLEKKSKFKQTKEAAVTKARGKYESECSRIHSHTQHATSMQGQDLERITQKRQRERQTVLTLERELAGLTSALLDLLPGWEADWKEFCDTCQDLEEDRIESMKDILWGYANAVSAVCVTDDASCENLRTALDLLEPERDVEFFVLKHGTGNTISEPTSGEELRGFTLNNPIVRSAEYTRESRRVGINYRDAVQQTSQSKENPLMSPQNTEPSPQLRSPHESTYSYRSARSMPPPTSPPQSPPPPVPPQQHMAPKPATESHLPALHLTAPPVLPTASQVISTPPAAVSYSPSIIATSPILLAPRLRGKPTPLPSPGQSINSKPVFVERLHNPSPTPDERTSQVLFYVEALYDYTATIEEEFDFQTGDVIAVTATPEDGWWSGELLDEARREEGRYIFPSNFVRLF